MARKVQDTTTDGNVEKGKSMRRSEIRVKALFDLVQHDYIDNDRKSKPTLDININKHLKPFFGERSAERLRTSDTEEYKTIRKAEGAKNSTINLELAALRRGFSLGNEKEIVINCPKIKLYNIGRSNRRTGFFEHSDYEKQLEALPPYARQVLRFGYACGWRQGEILKLTWADNYDEAGQVIRIFDSKSDHGRVLPLRSGHGQLTDAGHVIEEQKTLNRVKNCPYVFHFNGRPIHRATLNKHWGAACEVTGVKRHFHDLRRTVVRNLTRAGVHRTIAKAITGHETDDVFERYDIVDESDIRDGLSKMSAYVQVRDSTNNDCNFSRPVDASVKSTEETPATFDGCSEDLAPSPPDLPESCSSRLYNSLKSLVNFFRKQEIV